MSYDIEAGPRCPACGRQELTEQDMVLRWFPDIVWAYDSEAGWTVEEYGRAIHGEDGGVDDTPALYCRNIDCGWEGCYEAIEPPEEA